MTTVRNLLFTLLFGWIGLLPTVSLSQVVLSGGVTISGGYTVPGTWSDFVRRATVAVGQIKKDQVGVDRFTTGGAAVIIRETYDGADVFILGFPGLVGDQYQQRALMRSGIIAWTDSLGPVEHEFLVDSRIFPGNSGGPVFSSAAGMTRNADISSGKKIKLLGLVARTVNAKPELALGMQLPEF
jgi:hypothetical protein